MIEFENVSRRYGKKLAVGDVSFTIPSGELFALLGPNGAGKTTSIKMLVGLLRPSQGIIRVCGHNIVTSSQSAHMHLGYVPDEPCLYDKLTGREFLWFIAEMFGLAHDAAQPRIEKEIEYFQLAEFADDLAESYSLGMKQRLVFAASLIHEPNVLVLDEPMVGLDPWSVRIVKDRLKENTKKGMVVFMSTHTLAMAEEMADRIGVMVQGQLQFLGTVEELQQQISNESSNLEQLYLRLTSSSSISSDMTQ